MTDPDLYPRGCITVDYAASWISDFTDALSQDGSLVSRPVPKSRMINLLIHMASPTTHIPMNRSEPMARQFSDMGNIVGLSRDQVTPHILHHVKREECLSAKQLVRRRSRRR